jgi:hypothetical protein
MTSNNVQENETVTSNNQSRNVSVKTELTNKMQILN